MKFIEKKWLLFHKTILLFPKFIFSPQIFLLPPQPHLMTSFSAFFFHDTYISHFLCVRNFIKFDTSQALQEVYLLGVKFPSSSPLVEISGFRSIRLRVKQVQSNQIKIICIDMLLSKSICIYVYFHFWQNQWYQLVQSEEYVYGSAGR